MWKGEGKRQAKLVGDANGDIQGAERGESGKQAGMQRVAAPSELAFSIPAVNSSSWTSFRSEDSSSFMAVRKSA